MPQHDVFPMPDKICGQPDRNTLDLCAIPASSHHAVASSEWQMARSKDPFCQLGGHKGQLLQSTRFGHQTRFASRLSRISTSYDFQCVGIGWTIKVAFSEPRPKHTGKFTGPTLLNSIVAVGRWVSRTDLIIFYAIGRTD